MLQVHARQAASQLRAGAPASAALAQGANTLNQGPDAAASPPLRAPLSRAAVGMLAPLDPEPALWRGLQLETLAEGLDLQEENQGAAAASERRRQEAERQGRDAEARRHAIAEREARAKALFAKCGPPPPLPCCDVLHGDQLGIWHGCDARAQPCNVGQVQEPPPAHQGGPRAVRSRLMEAPYHWGVTMHKRFFGRPRLCEGVREASGATPFDGTALLV